MNGISKTVRRDALLGMLGALLMLVGDLCLSVIDAAQTDSGLFAREAYLSGSWEVWRLPLLLATGLCGMRWDFSRCASPFTRSSRSTGRPVWRFLREA